MVSSLFTTGASLARLLDSEVHVWLARPEAVTDSACLTRYIAMLDTQERGRYRRFLFEKDRHLFLVAHALVRRVLSVYVDEEPSTWRFAGGKHGRPEIAAPRPPVNLRFNLSHTDGLAACVVTLECACGIDVERIDDRPRMRAIATRVFAGPEQRDLRRLEGTAAYQQRFFSYWTLREAWYKALGTGLAHADRSVWFELDDDDVVRMRGAGEREGGAGDWQAAVLRPTAAHMLAIAVRSVDNVSKRVVCRFVEP